MGRVVDAQVHVWLPETPERPWPPGGAQWREAGHRAECVDAEVVEREMREAGVDAAVLVPPLFEGHRNDYALDLARSQPERYRVMARVDLTRPGLAPVLDRFTADALTPGVRLVFHPIDAGPITSAEATRFWPMAEERDLPVMVHVPGQLHELSAIAQRHPALRVAVDHLGISDERDGGVRAAIAPLLDLADLPNVSVKLTALPCFSTQPFPHPALHDPVRDVIDAFTPQRVFWGSDLSRLPGRYADAVLIVREHLGLQPADADAVLGESLLHWLRWDPPSADAFE